MNKEEIKEWIKYNKSKAAALVISFFYALGAIISGNPKAMIGIVFFLAVSLACIFFGNIMGGAMGLGRGGGVPAINNFVPESIMVFIGWVFLLFPLWGSVLIWLIEKSI
jgi:hypothetical protein